jgi:CubicO group peptidase (beta-lactamase class C family)
MDARAQWTGLDARRLERIGAHLQHDHIDTGRLIGCQIAVARHGHVAYAKSFGLMDRERAKPVADDAIWRIYSMTKPITSVALMTLYERGLFQLDDPVEKFVPSWRGQRVWVSGLGEDMITEPARRPASIRDLLSHTAGLTYGGLLGPDAELPIDALYRPRASADGTARRASRSSWRSSAAFRWRSSPAAPGSTRSRPTPAARSSS